MTVLGQSTRDVLIVDDHPIVRQGLRQLINREEDLNVCGEASDVKEARDVLKSLNPDVVILDLSLKDSDGLELLKDIRGRDQKLPVLVLSMHDEAIYAERLLGAGANGYIMKQAAADQLLTAVRRVLTGGVYVSEAVGATMIEKYAANGRSKPSDPLNELSNRELQVLNLVGRGQTTRQVAENLNLSVKTVESHRQRIKKKLGLQTASQLVQYAINWYSRQN
jgi:DNA-binding NarL/FixJ family response regulator